MEINLIKNTFYNEKEVKKQLCDFIFNSNKLSMGDECLLAEKSFASLVGRRYCVLFNSGSSANLALIQAYLNVGTLVKGDKVGFSSLTWSTNIMPLIQLGLNPVPIDVDINTLNVNSVSLARTIDRQGIKAFFATNILGLAGDLDNIKDLCDKNNILFFEDNCESLGSIYKGRWVGNFGHASTCSFFVGHHISTIEGGCVYTDDENLYNMLLMVRAHGWDRNLPLGIKNKKREEFGINSDFYDKYTFYDLGFNLRPTEIMGFLLNKTIPHAAEIFKRREEIFFDVYNHIMSQLGDKIFTLNYSELDRFSNFAIPIVFKTKEMFDEYLERFRQAKVEVRPIVAGNILLQPFFKKYVKNDYSQDDFKNIDMIHKQGLYFGNNPDLTEVEIKYIKEIF